MPKKNPTRENEATQETATGHEIPIPTREDVYRVFRKAVKPKRSRTRRPKKQR